MTLCDGDGLCVWRVVADLTPEGRDGITLADDVSVAGDFAPAALPADDRTARVETDAGTYTVTLEGDTAPGAARPRARLLMPRLVAGAATCAMAESGPPCPPGPLPSPKQSPPSGGTIPDKEEP